MPPFEGTLPGHSLNSPPKDLITVGRLSGLFGVRGWFRLFSHTDPRANILHYNPWYMQYEGQWREVVADQGQAHGKGFIVHIKGCDDRNMAAILLGSRLAICRTQLPKPHLDEFYWADLQGLRVQTTEGKDLGIVDHLLETGANDVLVVQGEEHQSLQLLPFVAQVIVQVDLKSKLILVDWDPDWSR